jgi:hypothetical protein
MLGRAAVVFLAVATGVALEAGIGAWSGRREAWDSAIYWMVGLPAAGLVSVAIGLLARRSDWLWTAAIVPSQVMTMMVKSGEIGNLWPLTLVFSSILSAPFVLTSFVASRFRPTR